MKLTNSQTALICRGLSLLLHAGISLADGIYLLGQEAEKDLEPVMKELGKSMDRGNPLSQAMADCGGFPEAAVGMVAVGEETGRMEETLAYLADYYDEQEAMLRQIRNALLYPSVLFVLMLAVLGVLLTEVLPVFDSVYVSLGSGLTGPAEGLLIFGGLLKKSLPFLAVLLAAVALGVLAYRFLPGVRGKINGFCLARFGDRGVPMKFSNALFARSMAMGLGSGMQAEEALELSHHMLAHIPGAAARCEKCRTLAAEGMELHQALEEAGLLPATQSRMLSLGMKSGSGDRVMEDVAQRLSGDAKQSLEEAVSRLEPAMVMVCALLVGLILLSVMLPLMDILAAIG